MSIRKLGWGFCLVSNGRHATKVLTQIKYRRWFVQVSEQF